MARFANCAGIPTAGKNLCSVSSGVTALQRHCRHWLPSAAILRGWCL